MGDCTSASVRRPPLKRSKSLGQLQNAELDEDARRSSADARGEVRVKLRINRGIAALTLVVPAAKMPDPHPRYLSPTELAVSPDGSRLYIVCAGTDELLVLNTGSQAVEAR